MDHGKQGQQPKKSNEEIITTKVNSPNFIF